MAVQVRAGNLHLYPVSKKGSAEKAGTNFTNNISNSFDQQTDGLAVS